MTESDISRIVRDQMGGRESLPNSHGVELKRCLTSPTQIEVIYRSVEKGQIQDSIETVWLVLEENPVTKDGYKVVFSDERRSFGLASTGFADDPDPVLCGYYGDFPTTLASM